MLVEVQDAGFGWIICLGCFLTQLLMTGMLCSFGVLYTELLSYFGASNRDTAWIMSLPNGVGIFVGPIVAFLVNKYGYRVVISAGSLVISGSFALSTFAQSIYALDVTIGLFGGIGYGMVYLPACVSLTPYFDKKIAMATGIAYSGAGVGMFILGPFMRMLNDRYTWRGTLLIMAGLSLNCLPIGLLHRTLNVMKDVGANSHSTRKDSSATKLQCGDEKLSGSLASLPCDCKNMCEYISPNDATENLSVQESVNSLWRTIKMDYLGLFQFRLFVMFSLSYTVMQMFFMVPNFYIPAHAVSIGITEENAAWLVSAMGVTNTLSRALFGWIFDQPCVNRMRLFPMVLIFGGICTAVLPLVPSYIVLMVYSSFYGLTSGIMISVNPILLIDIMGQERLVTAYSVLGCLGGVAEMLGSPLAGWLYDITGSYSVTFITVGVSFIASGSILFYVPCSKRNNYINMDL